MESKKKVWKGAERKGEDYDTKAGKVLAVESDWSYKDKDYIFESGVGNTIKDGLLVVGKLKAEKASLPEFWFRWDEKDKHLNVDIHGVDKSVEEAFRNGKKGYTGHYPKRLPGDIREELFEVRIRTRGIDLLCGKLRFRVSRDMAVKVGVEEIGATFYDLDW